MNKSDIEYVVDCYGMNKILYDHNLTKINVLEILEELHYVDLEKYLEKETNEYE